VVLVAIFIVGTLGLNFALFIAAMVGTEFGLDAGAFGLMNSIMAIGSVAGALLSAGRGTPRLRVIFAAAGAFGVTSGIAALAPNYFWYGVALVPVGLFAITMMTSANGYVQTTTDPVMRGRVMALYMAIFMGGTPIGAPFVGWVANIAGPRWSMGVAAVAGLLAALIGLLWIIRAKQLRLHFNRRARGLRYFRVASRASASGAGGSGAGGSGAGAAGAGPGAQPESMHGNDDGAAPARGRDDAVGR
jgi:MFS family permease